MIFYILLTIVAVFIARRVSTKNSCGNTPILFDERSVKNRICMSGLFTLLFLPLFFRIDTGNDYPTYIERFHDIVRGNYVVTEKGFNIIVKFIYWFCNQEAYIYVFGFFAFFTVLFFLISIYRQSEDFKMSFFLFMTLGLYFQCFNTVRYYFALSLVLFAMEYAVKKDYFKFVVIILIASLFHKSSLLVLPIYILAGINWKRIAVILVTIFSLTGFIFKKQYIKLLLILYPSYLEETEYINEGGLSIINILRCLIILALCLYYYEDAVRDNKKNRFYFYLNYAALIAYSCFYFIPFVSRIGYYMNICHILLLPSLIKEIKNDKQKKVIKVLVYTAGVVYFMVFLVKMAPGDYVKILPYKTWIFEKISFIPL